MKITSPRGLVVRLSFLLVVGCAVRVPAKAQAATQETKREAKPGVSDQSPRKRAWEILDGGAREGNRAKRAKATHALGLLAAEARAVELAEAALEDKEPEVRAAAARALGEMRSMKSVPKLEAATADKKISVALAAARSLVMLKNNAGYEVYYAVLTGERKGGGMIKEQLDELKDPKNAAEFAFEQGIGFVPFAGAGFEAIQMLTKKDPSPVRAAAATALASDPDPRSGAALAKAVSDKNWIVRVAVVRAIAKREDRVSMGAVEAAMEDKKDEVRYTAAAAVLRLTEGAK